MYLPVALHLYNTTFAISLHRTNTFFANYQNYRAKAMGAPTAPRQQSSRPPLSPAGNSRCRQTRQGNPVASDSGLHSPAPVILQRDCKGYGLLMRFMNSCRVFACSNAPEKSLVTVVEPIFSTPRICMHICLASITTITPSG